MFHVVPPSMSRRLFLSIAAGLLWRQKRTDESTRLERIVRSKWPEDLEMPAAGFADFITPISQFFVRSHVAVPDVDIATWRLEIDGHVRTPLMLSMKDLRSMPSFELVSVLECAGNGRSFYDPPVAGLQWTDGAVGNARWRGVRLVDLLKRAGIKPGTVEILFDGVDVPIGAMTDFQRSIPLKKALHPDTLLAFEMNGETLPVKHGFPLRLVVPGWAGDSWVKWVKGMRVLNEAFNGFWMANAYRIPVKPVAPGTAVSNAMMKPITSLRLKSVISAPSPDTYLAPNRPIVIRGAAWCGDTARVAEVKVSVDSGRSWKPARLIGPSTRFGWRLWEFPWTPSQEGRYTVLARARGSDGDMQPTVQEWNPGGYLWNAAPRLDLLVGIRSPEVASAGPDVALAYPEPQGFRETCLVCHGEDVIRQQRLTRAQWNREIDKMAAWGADVDEDAREELVKYLTQIAGPRK